MGISLAALLVMSVFFTGVLMMYRTTMFGTTVVSNAVDASAERAIGKSKTYIGINGVTASPTEDCEIEVAVENRGARPIYDFNGMDVIIHYQGSTAPIRLQYASTLNPSPADEWTLGIDAAVYPFEPSIFNPGEDAILHARLGLVGADNVIGVVLGTANGYVLKYSSGSVGVAPC